MEQTSTSQIRELPGWSRLAFTNWRSNYSTIFGVTLKYWKKIFVGASWLGSKLRSLDSICANIEEGFGRGFGKEFPQHLKIARGEARESQGRYKLVGIC